jgi:hypothetical protein
VTSRLKLQRVAVVGKVRLAKPPSGRGAVALCQKARSRWDSAGEQLGPDGYNAAEEFEQVEGDTLSAADAAIRGHFEGPGIATAGAETSNPVFGGVGPEDVCWGSERHEVEADSL